MKRQKIYISFVASHFGICMNSPAYKCTSLETFLGIPNKLYHIYFGHVRVLAQLKNLVFSADE